MTPWINFDRAPTRHEAAPRKRWTDLTDDEQERFCEDYDLDPILDHADEVFDARRDT